MHTVIDLGYGDAGKGTTVDWLTSEGPPYLVVRYTGGPQAAHHVVLGENQVHCFAQVGSGCFNGALTYLSPYMLIEPYAMMNEIWALESYGMDDVWSRQFIDNKCVVITPFHILLNRLREIYRGSSAHGSTGMGVWETRSFSLAHPEASICAEDMKQSNYVSEKLWAIYKILSHELALFRRDLISNTEARPILSDFDNPAGIISNTVRTYRQLSARIKLVNTDWFRQQIQKMPVVFEGAQGVLLSDLEGFHPHTSATDTTLRNVHSLLLGEGIKNHVLGVVRSGYMPRHGAGPHVTEEKALGGCVPEIHNPEGRFQGRMRYGYPDLLALRYAMDVAGKPDSLAVTCVDRMKHIPEWKVCVGYEYSGNSSDLDTFFEHDGNKISKIITFWSPDETIQLDRQGRLTQLLSECRPIYEVYPRDTESYLDLMEETLGVPISVVSYGPTSADKVVRTKIL